MSKAGKASDAGVTNIGREHPVPENIPHSTAQHNGAIGANTQGQNGSPVKESSYLQRETSADDIEKEEMNKDEEPEQAIEGAAGS